MVSPWIWVYLLPTILLTLGVHLTWHMIKRLKSMEIERKIQRGVSLTANGKDIEKT
jgi:hypothetical protein